MSELLRMEHISKRFGSFYANKDISLTVNRGEVLTLLGENGAGKSTLMNILIGLYQPTEGKIFLEGKEVRIESPSQAVKLGIGMVHQHFMLVEAMTVFDNIILGDKHAKGLFIDRAARRKEIEELSAKYGLDVQLDRLITEISVGEQQRTEILKALYHGAELLILDEPSAALTDIEVEGLFAIMRKLVSEGKSIIFISHKMREVMHISDRITVLRLGEVVGTVNCADTDSQKLASMMIGRELVTSQYEKKDCADAAVAVELSHVDYHKESKHNGLNDMSLTVRRGEIVCLAGIDGNGQTEFVQGLTGLDKITGGTVELCGKNITHTSIRRRGENMSHIPEDRHKHGLVLDFTLEQNMVLQRYKEPQFQHGGFIRRDAVREYADRLIEQFDVRSGQGAVTIARSMSGGNQQKAIIAREIDKDPKLLVAVQPTRGLDVGAIEYIHKQIVDERDRGKAVLLVSLELDEVMNLSDRILVMYEGEIVGEFDPKTTTVQELGLYMAGARKQGKEEQ